MILLFLQIHDGRNYGRNRAGFGSFELVLGTPSSMRVIERDLCVSVVI